MDLVKFPVPEIYSLRELAGRVAQELTCHCVRAIVERKYGEGSYCEYHSRLAPCLVRQGFEVTSPSLIAAMVSIFFRLLGKRSSPEKPFVPGRIFERVQSEKDFVACVMQSGYVVQSRLVNEWVAYKSEPTLTSVKLVIDRLEKIAISKDNPETENYKLQIDKKLDSLKSLRDLILIAIKEWVDCQIVHCSIPQVVPTSLLEKVDEINRIVDRLSQREQVSALAVHSLPSET